jgi:hypothetical protein
LAAATAWKFSFISAALIVSPLLKLWGTVRLAAAQARPAVVARPATTPYTHPGIPL